MRALLFLALLALATPMAAAASTALEVPLGSDEPSADKLTTPVCKLIIANRQLYSACTRLPV